jgi:hypothetical protein
MVYKGTTYAIQNGYTNAVYAYWTPAYPNNLVVDNAFPTLGADDCLIFLNKNGIATTVPTASVVPGDLIVPGSITANAIAANTITGDQIAAGAIVTNNIAAGAVSANQIAANAIGADKIAANTIIGDKLVADAITSREIASKTITANEIVSGTITATEIAAGTIDATRIKASTITVDKLASNVGSSLDISTNTSITMRATKEYVDGIQIGGRNLLKNTSSEYKTVALGQYYKSIEEGYLAPLSDFGLAVGDTFTYRVYINAIGKDKGGKARVSIYKPDNTYSTVFGSDVAVDTEGFSYLTTTIDAGRDRIFFAIGSTNSAILTNTDIDYKLPKVEKGHKFTDWSPAPEDIDKQISDTQTTIQNDVTGQITGAITGLETVYATKEELGTISGDVTSLIEQTPEQINISFTNATNHVNEVDGKLNTYKEEVRTNIQFDEDGINIGRTDSPFQVSIDNASMQFLDMANGKKIPITALTGNGSTVTVTYASQPKNPFVVGKYIEITGVVPTAYNGTYQVVTCTQTQVTFASTTTGSVTSIPIGDITHGFKADQNAIAWVNGQMMYIKDLHATNSLIVGKHKIEQLTGENVTLIKYVG